MEDKVIETRMRSRKREVETHSSKIEAIVKQLVSKFGGELDVFMGKIKSILDDADKRQCEVSTSEIESINLRIPSFMYFAVEGLEVLGLQGDTAKLTKMEVYNRIYLNTEGTIQDKTHAAEQETFPEYLLEIAFQRAYKQLKQKIDVAEIMCRSANKVLHKRITEIDVLRSVPNNQKETNDL